MIALALLLQAALPTPSPAPIPPPVAAPHPATGLDLHPGDSIIARVAADGIVSAVDGHPGERRPVVGEVRVDLRVTGGQSVLTVINPDRRFLLYRAIIAGGRARGPTSTCPVLPDGRVGVEHWPYPIDRLVLYGFRYDEHPRLVCR